MRLPRRTRIVAFLTFQSQSTSVRISDSASVTVGAGKQRCRKGFQGVRGSRQLRMGFRGLGGGPGSEEETRMRGAQTGRREIGSWRQAAAETDQRRKDVRDSACAPWFRSRCRVRRARPRGTWRRRPAGMPARDRVEFKHDVVGAHSRRSRSPRGQTGDSGNPSVCPWSSSSACWRRANLKTPYFGTIPESRVMTFWPVSPTRAIWRTSTRHTPYRLRC